MKIFSVIIPTCHRNEDLAKCLDCLAPGSQTLGDEFYEVIVSDDGGNSTAQQMIEECYPWASWTLGPRRGPAANRNHGAAQSSTGWLVFTDDDCLPSPGWLDAFAGMISEANVLEGLTRADRERQSYAEESPINLTGGYLWSCNFAIRRSTFEQIGGFDESFPAPAMEDCDLRENLREALVEIVFVPEAEVVHPWRLSKGQRFWDIHLQALVYYYNKHPHLIARSPSVAQFMNGLRFFKNNVVGDFWKIGLKGFGFALERLFWDMRLSLRIRSLLKDAKEGGADQAR